MYINPLKKTGWLMDYELNRILKDVERLLAKKPDATSWTVVS